MAKGKVLLIRGPPLSCTHFRTCAPGSMYYDPCRVPVALAVHITEVLSARILLHVHVPNAVSSKGTISDASSGISTHNVCSFFVELASADFLRPQKKEET